MTKAILTGIILMFNACLFGQTKSSIDDDRKIKIPVVFHVIYNNGNQNISDSLIIKELQDLNLDFTGQNDMSLIDNDFKNIVGNPNIEFYLLDTIFEKGGIAGIRRVSFQNSKSRNKLLIDKKACLNVIIADQGNSSDILSDRVNLNYKGVGNNGHTLTHEAGHWLGLYHIFGQIGNSAWYRKLFGNRDDLIEDTPEQKGATAICYSISSKCPCPPKKIFYNGHKRLYNNFMDYNPCRCMFTEGQSIKMRNNIIEHKQILFNNSKE